MGKHQITKMIGGLSRPQVRSGTAAVILSIIAMPFTAGAAGWVEQAILLPGKVTGSFGAAVDISGETVVVGSPSSIGEEAYVFRRAGGQFYQEAILTGTTTQPPPFDDFGRSVATESDLVVVGASTRDGSHFENEGAAYVYRFDGTEWREEQVLTAELTAELPESSNERFGKSVALSGNRIVVSKPIENPFDNRPGTAHVFRYDDTNSVWEEETLLQGSDATSEFGLSLDIDGDRIVVSARRAGNEFPPGAVYVFEHDGTDWIETRIPKPVQPGLHFGISVAISGDTIVVGTQFRGEAFVYRHDGTGWALEATLTASDPQHNDRFGELVDVDGDRVLVGAWQADTNAGAAYLFEYENGVWTEQAKLAASDAAPNRHFGAAVAVSGDSLVVGQTSNTEIADGAYVFARFSDVITSDLAGNLWIRPGETVYVTGGATVDGNAQIVNGTLVLDQGSTINGNLWALLTDDAWIGIRGGSAVDGNVRLLGGALDVNGGSAIGGNLTAFRTSGVSVTDSTVDGNVFTRNNDIVSLLGNHIRGNVLSSIDAIVDISDNDPIEGNLTILNPGQCAASGNTVFGNNSGCP